MEGKDASENSGVPNILHVVRYGAAPMTFMVSKCSTIKHKTVPIILLDFLHFFQEAVCIKAFLVHQRPDKVYLHSNIVDLTRYES